MKIQYSASSPLGSSVKGLAYDFRSTFEMSSIRMNQETVFGVGTRTTIPFTKQETRPNKKLKKSKKWDFSKGVSLWFWSKIGNFSTFLF